MVNYFKFLIVFGLIYFGNCEQQYRRIQNLKPHYNYRDNDDEIGACVGIGGHVSITLTLRTLNIQNMMIFK